MTNLYLFFTYKVNSIWRTIENYVLAATRERNKRWKTTVNITLTHSLAPSVVFDAFTWHSNISCVFLHIKNDDVLIVSAHAGGSATQPFSHKFDLWTRMYVNMLFEHLSFLLIAKLHVISCMNACKLLQRVIMATNRETSRTHHSL